MVRSPQKLLWGQIFTLTIRHLADMARCSGKQWISARNHDNMEQTRREQANKIETLKVIIHSDVRPDDQVVTQKSGHHQIVSITRRWTERMLLFYFSWHRCPSERCMQHELCDLISTSVEETSLSSRSNIYNYDLEQGQAGLVTLHLVVPVIWSGRVAWRAGEKLGFLSRSQHRLQGVSWLTGYNTDTWWCLAN